MKAYKSVLDIKEDVETASLYLPPKISIRLVDEFFQKGIKKVYLNPGSESDELIKKLKTRALSHCLCAVLLLKD